MTVEELLNRMSSREIAEWNQYMQIRAWEQKEGRSASGQYEPETPSIETLGATKTPEPPMNR